MGIIEVLAGLFRRQPGKDGMWDFLGKRSADKSRVELEKTRNDGTRELIPLLKPGMVLIEGGPEWFREIRMPEALPTHTPTNAVTVQPPVPPLPASRNELEAAPRNELEATPRQAQGLTDDPPSDLGQR